MRFLQFLYFAITSGVFFSQLSESITDVVQDVGHAAGGTSSGGCYNVRFVGVLRDCIHYRGVLQVFG